MPYKTLEEGLKNLAETYWKGGIKPLTVNISPDHLEGFLTTFAEKIRESVVESVDTEIKRVITIQVSGEREDTEFEKGYTTAYRNMRSSIDEDGFLVLIWDPSQKEA